MSDLKQFVDELNRSWMEERYDDLAGFFHEEVIMVAPGTSRPTIGVESMVDSYRQFASTATVHEFKITDLALFERGAVVMCHLCFRIDYEIESGRYQDSGMDVYAIINADTSPRIVWRTQLSVP